MDTVGDDQGWYEAPLPAVVSKVVPVVGCCVDCRHLVQGKTSTKGKPNAKCVQGGGVVCYTALAGDRERCIVRDAVCIEKFGSKQIAEVHTGCWIPKS